MANRTTTVTRGFTELQAAEKLTAVVYILQAAGFFIGITFIAAVIINYVKLDDVRGTWLESHFRWQIKTFWYGLAWAAIGVILMMVLIGFVIIAADAVWAVYRIVKGFLYLRDKKEMYL